MLALGRRNETLVHAGCLNEPQQHLGFNDVVVRELRVATGCVATAVGPGTVVLAKPAEPVFFRSIPDAQVIFQRVWRAIARRSLRILTDSTTNDPPE
jgi:hypothetical protein